MHLYNLILWKAIPIDLWRILCINCLSKSDFFISFNFKCFFTLQNPMPSSFRLQAFLKTSGIKYKLLRLQLQPPNPQGWADSATGLSSFQNNKAMKKAILM